MNRILQIIICLWIGMTAHAAVKDTVNQIDKMGRRQGKWQRVEDSVVRYRGQFKNDRPYGTFTYYDKHGNKSAVSEYFRDGYATNTTTFYPDGRVLSKGFYLEQERDSVWYFYEENGMLIKEEHYKNNLLHGTTKLYANDTLIEIQEWYRGQRNGKWWQKGNEGYQQTNYILNLSNGPYLVFYEKDKPRLIAHYTMGRKDSVWTYFDRDRQVEKKDYYVQNELKKRLIALHAIGTSAPRMIDANDIAYVQTNGKITLLKTTLGESIKTNQDFIKLTSLLDNDFFFFANPNFFAAFNQVKSIDHEDDKYIVRLKISTPNDVVLDEQGLENLKSVMDESSMKEIK